jgi:chromate transporter
VQDRSVTPPPSTPDRVTPATVSLAEAARFWWRLGLVSFGGPAGQIALLHEELVERRRWLSERRFLHALNYCMLLPGPEATQLATYLGWLMHGTMGGLIAGGLFLLPSVLVLLTLSSLYALWGHLPLLTSVFWALKPVVLAIVIQAAWRLARRTLHHPLLVGIAVSAFVGLSLLRLPYPWLVGAAALTGWIAGRLRPAWFAGGRGSAPAPTSTPPSQEGLPAVIHGDSTPTPEHGRFQGRSLALTLLCSGLALALPLAWLVWQGGWNGLLATLARFFTQVALVSFGGAYAVLPYVAQGAVERFGWLDAHQMIDGLALGETTPGPLIMVVAFVGFMGGWNGSGSLAMALQAALVVIWFTFLPSFVFILAGAPLVELSRGNLRLGPPLTAITAAVVGVIASLALLFAAPSLAPGGQLDAGALALCLAALVLLLRRGWGVMPLIGSAALLGVLRLVLLTLAGGHQ